MYAFSLLLRQTQINILNSLTRLSSRTCLKALNFACQMTMAVQLKIQVEKLHIIFCHASQELSKPYSYQKLLQKGGQNNPQIIAIWSYILNTRFLSKIFF